MLLFFQNEESFEHGDNIRILFFLKNCDRFLPMICLYHFSMIFVYKIKLLKFYLNYAIIFLQKILLIDSLHLPDNFFFLILYYEAESEAQRILNLSRLSVIMITQQRVNQHIGHSGHGKGAY